MRRDLLPEGLSLKTVLRRLGSIKLTITVLLLLTLAAAFGTFLPRGQDLSAWQKVAGNTGAKAAAVLGLTDFYHSVWFTGLLAALAVNLIACMANRLSGILSSLSGESAIKRGAVVDSPYTERSDKAVDAVLRSMGFKIRARGGARVYSRGAAGLLFTFMIHGSIVVIMIFSVFGSVSGFVATKRVYVGDSIETAYDWKARDDRPLPFKLRSDDLALIPNPAALRFGVLDPDTRHHIKVITTHVGGTFKVPGVKGRITVRKFDAEGKEFSASWTSPEGKLIEFGKDQEIGNTGLFLDLLAFATWPERQVHASVSVIYPGADIRSSVISINHPMVEHGIRIFLTDYGRDKFGFPYMGFQFVSDPGQAGVWTGCILFLAGLTGAVYLRPSFVVLEQDGEKLRIYVNSEDRRETIIGQLREKLILDEAGPDEGA
jgi:cytochrome c biogenesis protein